VNFEKIHITFGWKPSCCHFCLIECIIAEKKCFASYLMISQCSDERNVCDSCVQGQRCTNFA